MSRKSLTITILTSIILAITSFMSGLLYERWRESKSTLYFDRSLALLLARPTDFEISNGEWSNVAYFQDYVNPSINKYRINYGGARSEFRAYYSTTDTILDFVHRIERYKHGEVPQKTFLDETYLSGEVVDNVEILLLNLTELDENSRAFCILSRANKFTICFAESKYNEIVSTISISSENANEEQIIDFIKTAIQKFYFRLSKSSIT
jgi:hypothetical protein